MPYWNAFVATLEMHGKGRFFDPRLNNAAQFPIAAANGFGDLPHIPAIEGDEIDLPHAMGLHQAAALAGVSREDLIAANPAFLSDVTEGRTYIPRGYSLRVPPGGDAVQVANAEAPPRPERTQVARKARSKGMQVASASRASSSSSARTV